MTPRSTAPPGNSVDGIVLLDKPAGMSSNAALQQVKRLFAARKAGHTGSLDPLASGMLPVCLGEATKVAGALLEGRKRYQFAIALGSRTASGDLESAPVEQLPVPPLVHREVAETLGSFMGTRLQTPPMFSALKHQGKPLYRLARRGVEVERAAREITIESIQLDSLQENTVVVSTTCSKGTYIRALAEEIARALGTCGHVAALRRLWAEPFDAYRMHSLDELETANEQERTDRLLPPDVALQGLPRIDLNATQAKRLSHGQSLLLDPAGRFGRMRVYDATGRFLGIATLSSSGELQPQRLAARLVTTQVTG